MDASRDDRDRVASSASGERPVNPDGLTEQPLSPTKDGRIVSANSSDAAIVGPSRNVTGQPDFLDAGGSAYGSSTGTWNGYSQYLNADGLPVVSPFIYNDNQSLVFHSGYGFNPEIAYGQYSPVATPLPPLMMDGQLYSPQQLPFSTSFYPQSAPPNMAHISSAFQVPPTELMTPESSNIDNMFFGPGSGYLVNFGSLGGGNLSGNLNSSPLTSPTVYPQPMGILGPYENNFGQISQQHNPTHGFGLMSGPHYPHTSQNSSFGGASFSYSVASNMNQLTLDKGRRRDRDQDSISVSNDSRDIFNDRNRGPRASKLKGKSGTEQGSSTGASRNNSSASGILLDAYNRPDFVTDYENAKFFIIKSFSEDNVHKSIKYNIWASTPHGNKKLDAAYQEAKEIQPNCPIFLFFSVNASGQFCGVAEMVGPVDFEKNADYWQQDRWNGQFPVKWHIVKDVPNIRFRHILLDNNDNKPVTHSRDSQEVGLKQGVEMLKIFKDHDSRTSMLDDFTFYDDREKSFKERKAKQQQVLSTVDAAQVLSTVDAANKLVHEMSSTFGLTLNLKDGSDKAGSSELSVNSRKDTQASFEHESLNQMSGTLSQGSGAEEGDKVVASVLGEESVDKEATV